MIRLIYSHHGFSASSGLDGGDIHCGYQNATLTLFYLFNYFSCARDCISDTIGTSHIPQVAFIL
jgi:hypothetical protein